MDLFTISDIENLSGIKAHTLRIWEQRYKILRPQRRESKHRFYSNDDLKQILQIAQLNKAGYKISKIARLSVEQLRDMASEKGLVVSLHENFINQLYQASRDFDEERFNKIFHAIYMHIGFERTVLHVFYPLLQRIGLYWMTDQTRPVQEHFASHMVIKKMMVAIHSLEAPPSGEVTVLFNPEGENHEIPLLFTQYLLKKNGKRSRFFGANVSLDAIEEYSRLQKVDKLHLHVITNFSNRTMDEMVEEILKRFTAQRIIVSGPQVQHINIRDHRLQLINSMDQLLGLCNTSIG